ncbi:hypothetical protein SAMN04487881_1786 [Marinobacter sp. es.048]|uniref:hypothetical protein n=1 Tax=Marinobacter sp. es.048 TaxID=1761795 RepID=UPI000B5885DF|nr:hypothetical protein [Marinobacter sp. es.048]SNC66973.1 hypothetical protein SAMN04487881_1786 [Marinobacter sp. es.048]
MSRILKLSGNTWWVKSDAGWQELNLENAYNNEFIEDLNSCSRHAPFSDYINELYLYYFVRSKELEQVVGEVDESSYSCKARLADKSLLFNIRKKIGFKVGLLQSVFFYLQALIAFSASIFLSVFVSVILPFILLIKCRSRYSSPKNSLRSRKNVFFVRSKSGYSRAKRFIEESSNCILFVDDFSKINVPGESIYVVLWSSSFLRIYLRTLRYLFRDLSLFYKDASALLGSWVALSVFWDYWKRIPQKVLYEACFEEVLQLSSKKSELFSGEKEDRFAMLQTRCCYRSGHRLNCLPHGLEYGFRFPGGLCGSAFYCFSRRAKEFLESIYSSNKFLYSEDVVNRMLGIGMDYRRSTIDRVCFFTEPRDQGVNFEIINQLVAENIKFSVKLHPLENQEIYKDRYPNIDMISDLEDALSSSFCLSRKSTVLIEASQRGSQAIAILINQKDRFYVEHLFPSLSSEKIAKAYNFNDLTRALAINNDG